MRLNNHNLFLLKESQYSKNSIKLPIISSNKLLHFGVGGFHRSHQCSYTLDAMKLSQDYRWGITGIGIIKIDEILKEDLEKQNYLYSLIVKMPNENQILLMDIIKNYIYAYQNYTNYIKYIKNPELSIISMTITEGSYYIDKKSKNLDFLHCDIQHDLKNSHKPMSIYGYLSLGLQIRMEKGLSGVTLLSCDNIEHNGDLFKNAFLMFLEASNLKLQKWVKEHCSFPNSMVDRITPKATKKDQDFIFEKTGIVDQCAIVCEPFRQWIIEDNFVSERPKWELAGVQFVSDVAPYEKMKLRLLNGSHQALCYLGYLHGYRFVHEVMNDPDFKCFLMNYMTNEVQPTLDEVKGIDLAIYKKTLIERFSNPNILDTLQRICEFTSDRIPIFNLPVILENKEKQPNLKYASLILASWLVYLEGKDENGIEIQIVDHKKEMLLKLAKKAQANPQLFLDEKSIFLNLSENKQFIKLFEKSYHLIKKNGAKGALKALMRE